MSPCPQCPHVHNVLMLQEALPAWTDKHDILATLRVNNYDPHETINNYMARGGDTDTLRAARNTADAKLLEERDTRIRELEEKVKKLVGDRQGRREIVRGREIGILWKSVCLCDLFW